MKFLAFFYEQASILELARFRIKSGMTFFIVSILLTGCSALTPAEPLTKEFYQRELHPAVCYAVEQVNSAGLLTNAAEFGPAFEAAIGEYLAAHEIDSAAWIAARETHFTAEEHEKILKLHFAWCVSGMEELE